MENFTYETYEEQILEDIEDGEATENNIEYLYQYL